MRQSRANDLFIGSLIALLGLWGALIVFVGPYFDYAFGVNSTWHYTTDRLVLCILPGAAAFVGGLLAAGGRMRSTRSAATLLALTAGVWFVVGPPLSLIWEHHAGPIGPPLFGHTRQALELVGYFYGLGALIIALTCYATARWIAMPPAVVPAPTMAAAPSPTMPASSTTAAEPTAPAARPRRFHIRPGAGSRR